MMPLAPIALFVYNRPIHTYKTLQFLKQNTLAPHSMIFIFSDGPKNQADLAPVNQIRDLIKDTSGFKSVTIIERDSNFGLANSIIDGVAMLTTTYDKVIVFEDDLISSPYTLQYFNDALSRYQSEEKVMHIGAYMYPINTQNLPETFFHRMATSWGWATWARAWKHFEPNIDQLISQFDQHKIYQFSIEDKMNFWKQTQDFKKGKNNSWAIRWYASIFLNGGLTLNPAQSLIRNIGHDGTGIHSGTSTIYDVSISPQKVTSFPDHIQENQQAYQAIKYFFEHRKGTLAQRIIRLLKSKF
jgi:GT2 family glycosyltransferase